MDFIRAVFAWYETYSIIVLPLLIAIFVLGITLGIYQGSKDNLFRTGLLFPLFGVLLTLSFFTGDYGAELYLNLSAQVLMVLTAIILVGTATQLSGWLMPMMIVLVIAMGVQFLVPLENFATNMPATFSPALIGGIMAAYMLRQEWAWAPVEQSKRLSAQMRKERAEQSKREEAFGDFYMLVSGADPETITQRLDFLREHDMTVINQEAVDYDKHTETYYQLVNVKIDTVVKNPDSVFLDYHEARLQILGYPDVTKRVYKQLSEVLSLAKRKRIDAPDDNLLHVEVHATSPQRLYSELLEADFYELAREWQYGEDEHLQAATEALLEWAQEKQFVRK